MILATLPSSARYLSTYTPKQEVLELSSRGPPSVKTSGFKVTRERCCSRCGEAWKVSGEDSDEEEEYTSDECEDDDEDGAELDISSSSKEEIDII
ncbi:hypothetical protein Taro_000717 [Colocasia esculenta]|uniref:Uncharacterized protein n=1 Tax=Colocasia esculenta TaxID=4460 RepID=A0A843TDX8_COLES|nr:hypothetical protein [Colocasia esculenta]